MANYPTNRERTVEYLKQFDREKTLKYLIDDPAPLILDVGANVGVTLDEFRRWWPDSRVHCFEPQQECWAELEQRAAQYRPGDVVVNRYAVGNVASDRTPFYSHATSSGMSGFHKINLQSLDSIQLNRVVASDPTALREYEQSLNHEREVKVVRLDDYLAASGIDRVSVLKIDTQASEPEVLEGAGHKLPQVDVVIMELKFYDLYERNVSFTAVERLLLPAGLHLYDISHISKNPMNGRTDWVDVIYVNERIRRRDPAGRAGGR